MSIFHKIFSSRLTSSPDYPIVSILAPLRTQCFFLRDPSASASPSAPGGATWGRSAPIERGDECQIAAAPNGSPQTTTPRTNDTHWNAQPYHLVPNDFLNNSYFESSSSK